MDWALQYEDEFSEG